MIPLSVLELATVATGSTPARALAETTATAVEVERLGYKRLWVAEHHGMPAVGELGARGVDRAHRERHEHVARRFRRRDAAESRPARYRRTVRHPRGAASRPNRPRSRSRARHGSGHGARTSTHAGPRRGQLPERRRRTHQVSVAVRRRAPRIPSPIPVAATCPKMWLLGLLDVQRAIRRHPRAVVLLRVPLRAAATGRGARGLPFEAFSRRSCLDEPQVMVAVSVICAPSVEEAAWQSGPPRSASCR